MNIEYRWIGGTAIRALPKNNKNIKRRAKAKINRDKRRNNGCN